MKIFQELSQKINSFLNPIPERTQYLCFFVRSPVGGFLFASPTGEVEAYTPITRKLQAGTWDELSTVASEMAQILTKQGSNKIFICSETCDLSPIYPLTLFPVFLFLEGTSWETPKGIEFLPVPFLKLHSNRNIYFKILSKLIETPGYISEETKKEVSPLQP